MAEDADEHLVQPERLRELAPLPVEIEEDVGLAPEDVRVERLEEEVDRPRLVALEDALRVPRCPRSRR